MLCSCYGSFWLWNYEFIEKATWGRNILEARKPGTSAEVQGKIVANISGVVFTLSTPDAWSDGTQWRGFSRDKQGLISLIN